MGGTCQEVMDDGIHHGGVVQVGTFCAWEVVLQCIVFVGAWVVVEIYHDGTNETVCSETHAS